MTSASPTLTRGDIITAEYKKLCTTLSALKVTDLFPECDVADLVFYISTTFGSCKTDEEYIDIVMNLIEYHEVKIDVPEPVIEAVVGFVKVIKEMK